MVGHGLVDPSAETLALQGLWNSDGAHISHRLALGHRDIHVVGTGAHIAQILPRHALRGLPGDVLAFPGHNDIIGGVGLPLRGGGIALGSAQSNVDVRILRVALCGLVAF